MPNGAFALAQIGQCLGDQPKRRANLRLRHIALAKYVILQAIYQLTGLDFGARFVVVPDLDCSGCHLT